MKRINLIKAGLHTTHADALAGSTETTLTATGTTQADALPLAPGGDNSVVGTAAAGTGVALPPMEVGDSHFVQNLGANALLVYGGFTGSVINALSANAGFSVAAGKSAVFRKVSATNFATLLSA
jgi:hypothetical protein